MSLDLAGVSRRIPATPAQVFDVLSDGWSYASWVVGNAHVRAVDPDWPTPGSRIQHSVGAWPLLVRDVTTVRDMVPNRLLELDFRLGWLGGGTVRVDLRPDGLRHTVVKLSEWFERGPAVPLLPSVVRELLLWPRNAQSLARLTDLVLGRAVAGTALSGPGDHRDQQTPDTTNA
jgi:uncharacterized protein YndB with AHSA1/START domain